MNCLGSYAVGHESGVPHSLAAILVERRVNYETKKLDSLACFCKICGRCYLIPIMLSSPVPGELREKEDGFALKTEFSGVVSLAFGWGRFTAVPLPSRSKPIRRAQGRGTFSSSSRPTTTQYGRTSTRARTWSAMSHHFHDSQARSRR